MADRLHFIDVPPPEVIWVLGPPADSLEGVDPPGESAHAGQRVVGAAGTSGAGIASLGGAVGRPELRRDTGHVRRQAVPILVDDDADAPLPRDEQLLDLAASATRDGLPQWVARLANGGLRATRRTAPDLVAQLAACGDRPPDLLLCHALDADPLLPVQAQWGLRQIAPLRDGLALLAKLTAAREVRLVVPDALSRRYARLLRRLGPLGDVPLPRVVSVPDAYPQADPTLLSRTVADRSLTPGELPTDRGLFICDAAGAAAVGEVAGGSPCVRRQPVGIRDHVHDVAVAAWAWRGTRVADLLMFLGMLHHDPERGVWEGDESPPKPEPLRGGDYLRGIGLGYGSVLDGSECMIHVGRPPALAALDALPSPCIRCGWCLEICPTGVQPTGTLEAAAETGHRRRSLAQRHGAAACIGCGLCDLVCPSRLRLHEAAKLAQASL